MIDEEDDLEEDPPPLVGIEDFDTEDEVNAVARRLVEHGIGATVQLMVATGEDDLGAGADEANLEGDAPAPARGTGEAFYRHLVLDHEERRALEVLGLVDPEERPEANPVEMMTLEKAKIPWK